MERIYIGDLREHIGESVLIKGWISVRRDQGKLVFFDVRDRSGSVQAVVLSKSNALAAAKEIRPEWVVSIKGIVNKRPEKNINPNMQNGDIELEIGEIETLSKARELPFELGVETNLDTYFDYMPYTLRSEKVKQIFKVQETIIRSFREALKREEFTEFQAPVLVGADAEGGAAAFPVEYYYDQKAYLATSPQLYKQIMVGVYERVFATPKVFRAEKHSTSRHLPEYTSLDFEMGFIDDHKDVMQMLEGTIRHIVNSVVEMHDIAQPLIPGKIPILKLREAQKILNVPEEPDLDPEHERQICEWAKEKHASEFIFITHYPVSKRPFYTYEDENDPGFTKSFDLLFRGLEITTGGQRIHDHDLLIERIQSRGLDPKRFSFYLQTFKYGMPPHGGSATGLERITARLLNLVNVKEATLFPRDLNRIDNLLSTDEA
ncbi:aspartate--tRNA(Asn) ligase [Candidatus Kaiserbacteria bacterium RIFCSPLOWO2_12_FULL_50_28]|uniref:Aspartate--tRNA ligase n=2 Tax=Candidatus Kaiseribacteriota TaxID=1752734 RepID=A0A1F6FMU1_9BACT|nr:MAG: aspartate--tRNA(Asn) ligase [Candidatus Kaiserbacteria bacterium RIFCSPLOWO2_12_FULL_50_28]